MKNLESGWQNEKDREVIGRVKKYVLSRLKYHFVFKFDFKQDIENILIEIESVFKESKQATAKFTFSIKRAAYCFLLAFCDIYSEYSNSGWFKFIARLKLKWFTRINALREIYSRISNIGWIRSLQETRLLFRILRMLLIPLLGIPQAIIYLLQSLAIGIFYEGFLRFLYALVLMKTGYYALFLYGEGNTVLDTRIKEIPKKKLEEIYKQIKETISPDKWKNKSASYFKASTVYIQLLKEYGIETDKKVNFEKKSFVEKTGSFFSQLWKSSKAAFKNTNPLNSEKGPDDRQNLQELFKGIGKCYISKKKHPVFELRIREVLEMGYMASIMVIHKFLDTPGVNLLGDKITINMLINIKKLAGTELGKAVTKNAPKTYRFYRVFSIFNKIFRVARGVTSPYGLILTFGSPVLFEQLKEVAREYVYHNSGRLTLYGFERNHQKKKNDLEPLLW